MPKDTFINLPDEKRKLIEDAALDEFATWGYDNASINRIVAQTGIAKGSFYQYFEDKKDLLKHLVNKITQQKMEYVSPVLLNPHRHDFFTMLKDLYRSGLMFAKESPDAALLGNAIYKNKEHPIYSEIIAEGMAGQKDFFSGLLEGAIARGEVRPDIHTRFVAHVLLSLTVSVFEYYFEEVKGGDFNMHRIEDDVMDIVDMTLDFIKNGITQSKKELAI